MLDKILNLFFEEEEEANEAQLETLYFLTKKKFKQMKNCTNTQASIFAQDKICDWLERGKINYALKELWARKTEVA